MRYYYYYTIEFYDSNRTNEGKDSGVVCAESFEQAIALVVKDYGSDIGKITLEDMGAEGECLSASEMNTFMRHVLAPTN